MKIRVLIADNHEIVAGGIQAILSKDENIDVLGITANGRDVVINAIASQPDIVIMDVSMPELNGIDATREIIKRLPDTRVIALSMYRESQFVNGMIDAGARGYILKESAAHELITAIKMMYKGQLYFSPEVTNVVMAHIIGTEEPPSVFNTLTQRERETLQLVAEGCPSKSIAVKLGISIKTVETYRKRIAEKLNAHSIAELTRIAVRERLTEP